MTRRIALISEHASPLGMLGGVDSGGQNVYVGQLARHLAGRGYEVDVFTRRDAADLPDVAEWDNGARIVHVAAGPAERVPKEELLPYMGEFTAQVLGRCGRRPYDLVHANFWMSGLVAADVKRAVGTPFAITFHALGRVRRLHQGEADRFPEARFAIEDRIVAEADQIIAECPQDEEDLLRLYGADPARIAIIPCGFDPAELEPIDKALARLAIGVASEERVILQLGRMVPRKGVDTAIRGLARLVKDHDLPARLLVVGGESDEPDPRRTPELGRLQRIAEDEGVAEWVTFVGRRGREALKYYYSAADVFVTTPWYEPFGITPVESMACGTPVVGSNVGGIKFSVRDGETGYLVPPNDPDALAGRIAHLYRHPRLLDVFGRRAVKRANDLFTWRSVADAVAAVYEEILVSRPSPVAVGAAPVGAVREPPLHALVEQGFDGLLQAIREARQRLRAPIVDAAGTIAACFARGGKLLLCGNGGSAADAQHFAAEFVGRFKAPDRPALPALSLTADSAVLTAWANDRRYEDVFARQVEAFGRPGDVLVGISTSGRSPNVVEAFAAARRGGLDRVAILGRDGGAVRELADVAIVVPSSDTQHIQEIQIVVIHLICDLVEAQLAAQRGLATGGDRIEWELPKRNGTSAREPAVNGVRVDERASA
jgi:D-inositol-3-phosphate glycosyltransferase